ncbi:AEX-3 domain-containing protein [Pelagophyceae sp. CCMP2097]|nr:AEX-3 domain-containing protein [Pelagophyceae sp. CCMP2097]
MGPIDGLVLVNATAGAPQVAWAWPPDMTYDTGQVARMVLPFQTSLAKWHEDRWQGDLPIALTTQNTRSFAFARRVRLRGVDGRYDVGRQRVQVLVALSRVAAFDLATHFLAAVEGALCVAREEDGADVARRMLAMLEAPPPQISQYLTDATALSMLARAAPTKNGSLSQAPLVGFLARRLRTARNAARLLGAVLCERRILLHARDTPTLARCAAATASLAEIADERLVWPHTLLTVLPTAMLAYAGMPSPYIIGVRTVDLAAALEGLGSMNDDVILVDVDAGTVNALEPGAVSAAACLEYLNGPERPDDGEWSLPAASAALRRDVASVLRRSDKSRKRGDGVRLRKQRGENIQAFKAAAAQTTRNATAKLGQAFFAARKGFTSRLNTSQSVPVMMEISEPLPPHKEASPPPSPAGTQLANFPGSPDATSMEAALARAELGDGVDDDYYYSEEDDVDAGEDVEQALREALGAFARRVFSAPGGLDESSGGAAAVLEGAEGRAAVLERRRADFLESRRRCGDGTWLDFATEFAATQMFAALENTVAEERPRPTRHLKLIILEALHDAARSIGDGRGVSVAGGDDAAFQAIELACESHGEPTVGAAALAAALIDGGRLEPLALRLALLRGVALLERAERQDDDEARRRGVSRLALAALLRGPPSAVATVRTELARGVMATTKCDAAAVVVALCRDRKALEAAQANFGELLARSKQAAPPRTHQGHVELDLGLDCFAQVHKELAATCSTCSSSVDLLGLDDGADDAYAAAPAFGEARVAYDDLLSRDLPSDNAPAQSRPKPPALPSAPPALPAPPPALPDRGAPPPPPQRPPPPAMAAAVPALAAAAPAARPAPPPAMAAAAPAARPAPPPAMAAAAPAVRPAPPMAQVAPPTALSNSLPKKAEWPPKKTDCPPKAEWPPKAERAPPPAVGTAGITDSLAAATIAPVPAAGAAAQSSLPSQGSRPAAPPAPSARAVPTPPATTAVDTSRPSLPPRTASAPVGPAALDPFDAEPALQPRAPPLPQRGLSTPQLMPEADGGPPGAAAPPLPRRVPPTPQFPPPPAEPAEQQPAAAPPLPSR